MAYTLTLHSISPTTAENLGNVALRMYFSLSGSGFSIPGFTINLYSSLTGGTIIKQLYYSDMYDPISGNGIIVNFNGVSPGTYYIELFYKTTATPRRAITITGTGGINQIKLNGNNISSNKINNSNVTKESLDGNTVYES